MPDREAGSGSSLFNMQEMRAEDGPPLPMVGYMRGLEELQGFPVVSHLYECFLLAMLLFDYDLALARGIYRG